MFFVRNSEESFAKSRAGSLSLPFIIPVADGKDIKDDDQRGKDTCGNGCRNTGDNDINEIYTEQNCVFRGAAGSADGCCGRDDKQTDREQKEAVVTFAGCHNHDGDQHTEQQQKNA